MTRTPPRATNNREPKPSARVPEPDTYREGWPIGISDQAGREMLRGCGFEPSVLNLALQLRRKGQHQSQRAQVEAPLIERGTHERQDDGAHVWRKPKAQRPRCGARTRKGTPCAAPILVRSDESHAQRCRIHGGASTGPRSQAGREAIAASNRRRAQAKGLR